MRYGFGLLVLVGLMAALWAILPDFGKRSDLTSVKPAPVAAVMRTNDARIALVTAQPLDAARTLQDLALVNLGKEKGIVLLQRDAVDKILAEHKLNQSGLVEAKSAVQLGKILAVDLIGMIDVSVEAKEPLGFVVFDAVTGVRLCDDGFGKEKIDQQLHVIAKGVQSGVLKWRAGTKHLKTVCVLPARNADLPRGMDAYCEAMGTALERQLVHHASIVTLERKWLDSVNQEKTIAVEALSRELLASVLVVDLEIARGEKGKGVRGTIRVRDNTGEVLHAFAHQVDDDQGADLLGPLTLRLHGALDTAVGAALVEPSREARRFLHETEILWRHGHFRQALQAAEAAYALTPTDETRIVLAECLLQYPREMWRKKPAITLADRYQFAPVERTAAEVRAGLSMVQRGHRLVDVGKPRVQELPDHGRYFSLAETNNCFYADANTWDALKAITISPVDPSIADELFDYRKNCINRHLDRIKEIVSMKRWTPKYKLQRLTPGLRSQWASSFERLAPDSASFQKALRDASKVWLDVSYQIPMEDFPVEMAGQFAESTLIPLAGRHNVKRSDADIDAATAIFKALLEHPHPVMRLYGANLQMKQDFLLQRLTPQEAEKRFRDNLDDAKRWIDQAPFKNPDPHRVAFYEFFKVVLWDAMFYMDRKVIDDAYAGIVDYMLDRKDVAGPQAFSLVGHNLMSARHKLFGRLQQLYRYKEMYERPNHRLFYDPTKEIPRHIKHHEMMILQVDPTLAKQKLEAPWDKVIRLVEVDKLMHASRLYTPVQNEGRAYVLAGVHDPDKKINVYLQLHCVALEGGEVQPLGKLPITLKDYDGINPHHAFNHADCVIRSCIHGKHFIAGTLRDGIFIFPLDGGVPARIGEKQGLPAQEVNGLTAIDNQVIASLNGGYLVQIDLATRRIEVLASSRRTNKLSPFDNDRPFYIRSLVPDPSRQRVLFTAGVFGTADHSSIGMWEYNLKARTFKKHLPMVWFNFSGVHGDVVYMEEYQHEWLGQFDLSKDQFTILKGKTPDGLDKQRPSGLPQKFTAKFPDRLYDGGFLWETSPFARRSLQTDKEEFLPHPAQGYTLQVGARECLEPIRPGELLVGDWRGLYAVRLKK